MKMRTKVFLAAVLMTAVFSNGQQSSTVGADSQKRNSLQLSARISPSKSIPSLARCPLMRSSTTSAARALPYGKSLAWDCLLLKCQTDRSVCAATLDVLPPCTPLESVWPVTPCKILPSSSRTFLLASAPALARIVSPSRVAISDWLGPCRASATQRQSQRPA